MDKWVLSCMVTIVRDAIYTECEGHICISLNKKFDCVLQGKHPSKSLTNCANDTEETSYHHNHIPQL